MSPHVPPGSLEWRAYDPQWLVELARNQRPLDDTWLPAALAACTRAAEACPAQVLFVDPSGPEWRYRHDLALESDEHGPLVLAVLEGPRIGALEFVNRIGACPDHYGD